MVHIYSGARAGCGRVFGCRLLRLFDGAWYSISHFREADDHGVDEIYSWELVGRSGSRCVHSGRLWEGARLQSATVVRKHVVPDQPFLRSGRSRGWGGCCSKQVEVGLIQIVVRTFRGVIGGWVLGCSLLLWFEGA